MNRSIICAVVLVFTVACGPSLEKMFEKSIQTASVEERKKLREEILKKYPDHPYGIFSKAYLLGANGEKEHFLEQLELYSKVITLQPNLAAAYVNRGMVRENLKLEMDALADYNKAIELNPNLERAYFRRGNIKFKQNNSNAALIDYGMAINLNPKNFDAYLDRGRLYNRLKKYREALNDLDVALGIAKDDSRALFERGLAKHGLKDNAGAIADYGRVDGASAHLKAAAELNVGLILQQEGKPRAEYCLHFGNAYQRDKALAAPYYSGNCS